MRSLDAHHFLILSSLQLSNQLEHRRLICAQVLQKLLSNTQICQILMLPLQLLTEQQVRFKFIFNLAFNLQILKQSLMEHQLTEALQKMQHSSIKTHQIRLQFINQKNGNKFVKSLFIVAMQEAL